VKVGCESVAKFTKEAAEPPKSAKTSPDITGASTSIAKRSTAKPVRPFRRRPIIGKHVGSIAQFSANILAVSPDIAQLPTNSRRLLGHVIQPIQWPMDRYRST